VMACKGVSTFLTLWLCCNADLDIWASPFGPFSEPELYLLLLVLISTAVLQIRYLNRAMENFGNTETVPVYYVLFTICTIVGSSMLYKDFQSEDREHVLTFALGCLLTFAGVKLLTSASAPRPSDGRIAPLMEEPGTEYLSAGEPSLDRLYQHHSSRQRLDEEFDGSPPLTLLSTHAMGHSSDMLRRTFTSSPQLNDEGDVAAQRRGTL